jgi:hypothetical protein
VRLDFGINALVGAANDSVTLFDLCIDTPVTTCPIRVLSQKANTARNK